MNYLSENTLPDSPPESKPIDWKEATVTVIPLVTKTKSCRLVQVHQVVDFIKGDRLIAITKHVREVRARLDAVEAQWNAGKARLDAVKKAREDFRNAKRNFLPAALFSGEFDKADDDGFRRHSGLLMVDLDGFTKHGMNVEEWKKTLASDPHTVLLFVSPSGSGLKWLVPVKATDEATHKACFEAMKVYVCEKYPELAKCIDENRKDLSGKCFLCHDSNPIQGSPSKEFAPDQHQPLLKAQESASRNTAHQHTPSGSLGLCISVSSVSSGSLLHWDEDFDIAIPKESSQNNHCLLLLSRAMLDRVKEAGRDYTPAEEANLLDQWLVKAKPFLTHGRDEYLMELRRLRAYAKYGLKDTALMRAWERSEVGEVHPSISQWYSDPDILRMDRLCRNLHELSEGGVFWLASRSVEKLMCKRMTHVTASRWLKEFVRLGVLTVVEQGGPKTNKATRYRYNHPAPAKQAEKAA